MSTESLCLVMSFSVRVCRDFSVIWSLHCIVSSYISIFVYAEIEEYVAAKYRRKRIMPAHAKILCNPQQCYQHFMDPTKIARSSTVIKYR